MLWFVRILPSQQKARKNGENLPFLRVFLRYFDIFIQRLQISYAALFCAVASAVSNIFSAKIP